LDKASDKEPLQSRNQNIKPAAAEMHGGFCVLGQREHC
jgi:hypothetical protein